MGGISIAAWALFYGWEKVQGTQEVNDWLSDFSSATVLFLLLSVAFNYPHFISSYHLAYGRGREFILKHWFSLILVPVALVISFAVAYFTLFVGIRDWPGVTAANDNFLSLGLHFRLGQQGTMGREILNAVGWGLYITSGWHYLKQVYGGMMVFSYYDRYSLSPWQRNLIKVNLIAIAAAQLAIFMAFFRKDGTLGLPYLMGFKLTPVGLDNDIAFASMIVAALLSLSVAAFVIGLNYRRTKKLPSACFLVPWAAYHLWALPVLDVPLYYLMLVPLFHAIQYLPFVYRLEAPGIPKKTYARTAIIGYAATAFVGFMAFKGLPHFLDGTVGTLDENVPQFFTYCFVVFMNVHHFFIDGVIWRFDQKEVQTRLLAQPASKSRIVALSRSRSLRRAG
jgi:hypothetical protein